jgi:nucleotide-binding universal stress UspA family protein
MRALVAVDLASRPEEVLAQAAQWAARVGATLDVCYVDDTPAVATYITDPSLTAIFVREVARLRERHAQRVDALLGSLPEDRRGAAHVLAGSPAEAVVTAAVGFDLLIVATHGRRGLAHLWLGSVAEKIVRASSVPVLVLHLGPTQ